MVNSNTTREGIEVKPGQVWRDLDKRMDRTVTVQSVSIDGKFANVVSSNGSKSKIAIKRMHKHGQGFALVSDT